ARTRVVPQRVGGLARREVALPGRSRVPLDDAEERGTFLRDPLEEAVGGAHGLPAIDEGGVDGAEALVGAAVAVEEGSAAEGMQATDQEGHVLGDGAGLQEQASTSEVGGRIAATRTGPVDDRRTAPAHEDHGGTKAPLTPP